MDGNRLKDALRRLRSLVAPRYTADLTDSHLLNRFVGERDQAAFEALLLRHGPMVWNVCRKMLLDPRDVEDAFQATWLVLVRRAGSIRRRHLVGNWLYGVAHRVASRARLVARRQRDRQREMTEGLAWSTDEDPAARERDQIIQEELNRLPARYRLPLILCYLEGRTQVEAAHTLGWSAGTVRGRLERGRQRLRQRLERCGILLSAGALAIALEATAEASLPPVTLSRATSIAAVQFLSHEIAALAGSRSALALAEGVCTMMRFARFRTVALAFVLLGLCGGGAGLLAGWRPDSQPGSEPGQETTLLQAPQAAADPVVVRADERPKSRKELLQEAQNAAGREITELDSELLELDMKPDRTLNEERRRLIELEERLHQLESQDRAASAEESDMRKEARREIEKIHGYLDMQDPQKLSPEQQAKRARMAADRWQEMLHQIAKQEIDRRVGLIEARLQLSAVQDRIRTLERVRDRQRQRLEGDLDAAVNRLRQLRWGNPEATSPESNSSALEQKVNRLLREVQELRREVRNRTDR
jgi:RNA polymerase sigma factor (sigma-70 family)